MQKIEFCVKLQAKDLFFYTMRHTYYSLSGVFGLLISLGSFLLFLLHFEQYEPPTLCVLLLVALLFPVIQPVLLYIKCRKQVKKSKDINEELSYTLTEDLITVRQGEQEVQVHWYDIRKVVYGKNAVYVYMSPIRAFIFPKDGCGEQFSQIPDMIQRGMEKYKDYEPEQEDGSL